MQHHVAVYEKATCHTMCACARTCVCARMCVINENKHPFQDFRYLISHTLLIYLLDFSYFHHVRLFSYVFMR